MKKGHISSKTKDADLLTARRRPELVTDFVYDAIRDAILQRRIKPGERVTEASLAERLSVSKTPVREALLRLRRIGLIVDWGKRGGSVIKPSRDAFLEISEAREAIEVFVGAHAAQRATQAQKQAITALAEASVVAANERSVEKFHWINVSFHHQIAVAAGNLRLADMLVDILDLNSLLRERDLPPLDNLQRLAREHLIISQAIDAADAEAAALFSKKHVLRSREENLAIFAVSKPA